jgi:hypothetical protein
MFRLIKVGVPLAVLGVIGYILAFHREKAGQGHASYHTDTAAAPPRDGTLAMPAALLATIAEPKSEQNPAHGEDQSIENKLAAARAQLERLEASVYSNNLDASVLSLDAVEAYREVIEKWGMKQAPLMEDLTQFVAVADPIEAKKRSQAYVKAENLMIPLVIRNLSAQDTNFFALFKTASILFLSGETAWQILTHYDAGDRYAAVPSADERTFERYIEEANKRNQQLSDVAKQIADEAGMPTNALEAIRIDATIRLLRSAVDMYKHVATPHELVALRREVAELEILADRERAP